MNRRSSNCSRKFRLSPWDGDKAEAGFNGRGSTSSVSFLWDRPIANGIFRKIVIRKNRMAQVDVRDLSILRWTDRYYYEVCANPAVYAAPSRRKISGRVDDRHPASVLAALEISPHFKRNLTTASRATGFPARSAERTCSGTRLSPQRRLNDRRDYSARGSGDTSIGTYHRIEVTMPCTFERINSSGYPGSDFRWPREPANLLLFPRPIADFGEANLPTAGGRIQIRHIQVSSHRGACRQTLSLSSSVILSSDISETERAPESNQAWSSRKFAAVTP